MERWTLSESIFEDIYEEKDRLKALEFLSEIIVSKRNGITKGIDDNYLREILNLKIKLLLELEYYVEALAWACLECELYPEELEIDLQKDEIKSEVRKLLIPINKTEEETVSNNNWGTIVGMQDLKYILERDLISPLKNPGLYLKYSITVPKGFLFFGPPGCGKTLIARQIAKILQFNLIEVSPSSVGSIYVHGTQNRIRELFDEAYMKRPSILFIDEFEAFAPNRNRQDVGFHYQGEVNELLVQLNNASDRGIVFIGATNFISNIDSSILRPGRIDKKIYFGPPDFEARLETFKINLRNTRHFIKSWDYLGEETENYTYAEISYIVDEAKRKANEERIFVNLNHIMKAVKENPPSLNETEIKKYMR